MPNNEPVHGGATLEEILTGSWGDSQVVHHVITGAPRVEPEVLRAPPVMPPLPAVRPAPVRQVQTIPGQAPGKPAASWDTPESQQGMCIMQEWDA